MLVNPFIVKALAENRHDEPVSVLYKGMVEGKWTLDDVAVWEKLGKAEQKRLIARERRDPGRGYHRDAYQTRLNRPIDPGRYRHGSYIATQSSQATLDTQNLPAGAVRFLNVLTMRRGRRLIAIFTAAFARDLRCCERTIRNWITALVNAGYVTRCVVPHSRLTHLSLTERCFAPGFRERNRKRVSPQVVDSSDLSRQKNAGTEDTRSKESKVTRSASSGTRGEPAGAAVRGTGTPGGSRTLDLPLVGGEMRSDAQNSSATPECHPTGAGFLAKPKEPTALDLLCAGILERIVKPAERATKAFLDP